MGVSSSSLDGITVTVCSRTTFGAKIKSGGKPFLSSVGRASPLHGESRWFESSRKDKIRRRMREVMTGSFESSRVILREKLSSPKGRRTWRGQAVQVYNKFTKMLVKRKPANVD